MAVMICSPNLMNFAAISIVEVKINSLALHYWQCYCDHALLNNILHDTVTDLGIVSVFRFGSRHFIHYFTPVMRNFL